MDFHFFGHGKDMGVGLLLVMIWL